MALKGNLRDFTLHQLLNLINLAHKTGALTVRSENGRDHSVFLFFRDGRLIHASFDGQAARLTDVLIRVGKITPEQAQVVQDRSRVETDKELGLLLMQYGYLSQTDIVQGVRGYLLESVYQLFTWPGGSFHFEPNQVPPDERITVPLNLENVLLEGGRRQQEWDKLREEIPDLDVGLRFANRPGANLRNISLSVDEWKFISFINSGNSIRQIGKLLGMDEYQARRVVHGLHAAGLVELARPQVIPAAPPPPPKPAAGARLTKSVIRRIIDGIRRR